MSVVRLRRILRVPATPRRNFASKLHQTDSTGIPIGPTWSVHELLESYPKPSLSHAELNKLHRLSALQPPAEKSQEFSQLKGDLEQLVKLVEAVKLVDTKAVRLSPRAPIPEQDDERSTEASPGRELLRHSESANLKDGFYAVKTPKLNTTA